MSPGGARPAPGGSADGGRRAKPDPATAMRQLIAEIRAALPFGAPASQLCGGDCRGCSLKLLDYLDGELADWTRRLDAGESPRLGDVSGLGRLASRVRAVLEGNGALVPQGQAERSDIPPSGGGGKGVSSQ